MRGGDFNLYMPLIASGVHFVIPKMIVVCKPLTKDWGGGGVQVLYVTHNYSF